MQTKTFPTLFKQSETGAIVEWNISVEDGARSGLLGIPTNPAVIVTRWGQEGGAVQETKDLVAKGKNVGKKNETTPFEQAVSEAKSKWEKQQKAKKYVQNRADALSGKRDAAFVAGGIDPMLAFPAEKKPKAIKYPMDAQPKLDGHRCIAVIEGGKATLWSRTRKPIYSAPHIVAALEQAFGDLSKDQRMVLDGELYNHAYKADFEALTSLIRASEPQPGHEAIQYHVYDAAMEDAPWSKRRAWLADCLSETQRPLVLVETTTVASEDDMLEQFQTYLGSGYEGLMLRAQSGGYENKRSAGLLKVKEMQDAEFKVVGVEEGRGKLAGHAVFVCETNSGKTFNCKMVGAQDALKKFWDKPSLVVGKLVTVKYQSLTADGLPRFPVALRIRTDI